MVKNIVLFYNSRKPNAAAYAAELERRLEGLAAIQKMCVFSGTEHIAPADAAIAVGGDGTVLYAARRSVAAGLPVLGINAGMLGFLSGIGQDEFIKSIPDFLAGKFLSSERMMLSAAVIRNGKTVFGPYPALNDCSIRCSHTRAFGLKAMRGSCLLTKYFGDGLIIATPSGSTAYSLAASGPIVAPEQDLFILAPICPHALTQRPIILPPDMPFSVELLGVNVGRQKYTVSLDGQAHFPLHKGDIVQISRQPQKLLLLVPPSYDYFATLRAKLRWGER